jgi:hypothetical protein
VTSGESDSVSAEYRMAYGAELGALMSALWNETAWLYVQWHQYVTLFGEKASRVELLNRAAPVFFRVVEDALWDQTLLAIARLVDRPQSPGRGKRSNLTVAALPSLISDTRLRGEVEGLCADARAKSDFAVDWRNRRIAHRDLALTLGTPAEALAPASRLKVRDALDAIAAVTQHIERRVRQTTPVYDLADHPGDAWSVLKRVRDGLAFEVERHERLRRGEPRPDDFKSWDDL